MLQKYGDIYAGLFLLALSVVMYVTTFTFRQLSIAKIGPAFAPRLVAVAIFILSAVLVVNGIMRLKKAKHDAEVSLSDNAAEDDPDPTSTGRRMLNVALTAGIMAVYIALMEKLGFLLTTFLYLVIQMLLLSPVDRRKWLQFLMISAVTSYAIYFFFRSLFYLMLPDGILG